MAVLTATGINFSNGTSLNSRRGIFPQSTAWVYYQANAPTGWTKVTTQDNKALRVVSGAGGAAGGTNAFTTTMSSFTLSGQLTSTNALGGTALILAQIPSHNHPNGGEIGLNANPETFNPAGQSTGYSGGDVRRPVPSGVAGQWIRVTPGIGNQGSNGAHDHPFSGTGPVNVATSIAVQYIDVIVCTFDG
jgi:hypothetical protein